MKPNLRIVRIAGGAQGHYSSSGDVAGMAGDQFVLHQTVPFEPRSRKPLSASLTREHHELLIDLTAKLNALSAKYLLFLRNMASCVRAIPGCPTQEPPASSGPSVSRSPSEGAASSSRGERGRHGAVGKAAALTFSEMASPPFFAPNLATCWAHTAPLPPTAALAGLFGMLPLHHASWHSGDGDEAEWRSDMFWSLFPCVAASSTPPATLSISYREAFSLTAVAAHVAAGAAAPLRDSAARTPTLSSSAISFSLAHQVSRASVLLDADEEQKPLLVDGTLLGWPEDFLWSLLIALLSVLELTHSAGLHFSGQLTAADVLCFACSPSLPRQLEQTWRDVAADAPAAATSEDFFQRFYTTAVPNVVLPQATLTATTPSHHVLFVLRPSLELLQHGPSRDGHTSEGLLGNGAAAAATDSSTSSALLTERTISAQAARFQAADLASVGRLLSLLIRLRTQEYERSRRVRQGDLTTPLFPASPSSELTFLVRRLCECGEGSSSSTVSTATPTALQLLQLQALRLRTETAFYRRLAEESCDRLLFQQQQRRESDLRKREMQVAAREEKLNMVLHLYELTHEYLDALANPPVALTGSIALPYADVLAGVSPIKDTQELPFSVSSPPLPLSQQKQRQRLLVANDNRYTTVSAGMPVAEAPRAKAPMAPSLATQPDASAVPGATVISDDDGDGVLGLSPLTCTDRVRDETLLSIGVTPRGESRVAQGRVTRATEEGDEGSAPATHHLNKAVEVRAATSAASFSAAAAATARTGIRAIDGTTLVHATPSDAHKESSSLTVVEVNLDDDDDNDDAAIGNRSRVDMIKMGTGWSKPLSAHTTAADPLDKVVGDGLPSTATAAAANKAVTAFFHASGSYSPDSYRSSTRPYTMPAGGVSNSTSAALRDGDVSGSSQQRPQRRRSSPRGSRTGTTEEGASTADSTLSNADSTAWARQQLTVLESMQSALRAQPLYTPRGRASAAMGGGGMAVATAHHDHAESAPAAYAPRHVRSPPTPSQAPRQVETRDALTSRSSPEETPTRDSSRYLNSPEMRERESAHLRSATSHRSSSGSHWRGDGGGGGAEKAQRGALEFSLSARPRVLISSASSFTTTPPSPRALGCSPASVPRTTGRATARGYETPAGQSTRSATAKGRSPSSPPAPITQDRLPSGKGDGATNSATTTTAGRGTRITNTFYPSLMPSASPHSVVAPPSARSPRGRDSTAATSLTRTQRSSTMVSSLTAAPNGVSGPALSSSVALPRSGGTRSSSMPVTNATTAAAAAAIGLSDSPRPFRKTNAISSGSSRTFSLAGAPRVSSTSAVELLRRLRTNPAV